MSIGDLSSSGALKGEDIDGAVEVIKEAWLCAIDICVSNKTAMATNVFFIKGN